MAGMESVVVDYMGIGDVEADRKAEGRGKLVKPLPAHAMSSEKGFARGTISETDPDVGRPLLNLGTGSSHNASQSNRVPNMPWIEDMDIAKLSGEDCRLMLQMMKGAAGMSHAVANSKGTMVQPTTILGMNSGEERPATIRRGALLGKSGQPEALTMQPGRLPSNIGMRGFKPLRFPLQSSPSVGEAHEGARTSERAVPVTEPSLSLSIRSTQDQSVSPAVPAGLRMLRQPELPNRGLQLKSQSGQGASTQAGAASRAAGQTHLPGRPPTSQLTIFYSGRVNVYDDVPADKAEAIMLLAGSGSSWSSSTVSPPQSTHPATQSVHPASQSVHLPGMVALPTASKGLAAAVASVSLAGPAMPALVSSVSREMPQARKKSLARFFENRKDRVRARSPYVKPEGSAKRSMDSSNPAARDRSPSPGNGTVPTRSPSPAHVIHGAGAGAVVTRSPSPAQRPAVSRASKDRTISPTKPPATPQQSSRATGSEDLASNSASQGLRIEGGVDWRNHPRISSNEQKPEAMEEGH